MRLRGEKSLSDLPRPDRLGLFMKYVRAVDRSSPSAAFIRFGVPSGNSFQLCPLFLEAGHHGLLAQAANEIATATVGFRTTAA
jgi:hypothetical protein